MVRCVCKFCLIIVLIIRLCLKTVITCFGVILVIRAEQLLNFCSLKTSSRVKANSDAFFSLQPADDHFCPLFGKEKIYKI